MRTVLIILFFGFPLLMMGQNVSTSGLTDRQDRDSIRNYYIKHFPDYFFLYPVLKQRHLNFELQKESGNKDLVTFKPNNAYSFGMGMYLFEINAELTFAIPIDQKSKLIYGESKARDVQLNVLGKSWGLDAFYQRYTGFYITDSQQDVPANYPYPQRADIASRNRGLTGYYVFNHQKFSFRSAYNFAERQIFSKGSVLLSSSLSSFRMSADSSILDRQQRLAFGDDVAFTKLRYATFSVAPGYTYSVVFESFFLNGSLSVGPAHNWINYSLEGGPNKSETGINTFVAARLSLGYNGERIFGGISFLSQGNNIRFQNTQFSNNNGSFKILLGYRFREGGFLKKRVWDLVPFKI
jgi:hypothetical protein